MERPSDPKNDSNVFLQDDGEDALEDQKTRPRFGARVPLGKPNPMEGAEPPTEVRKTVAMKSPPRTTIDSAIELDDDALVDVEDDAKATKPPRPHVEDDAKATKPPRPQSQRTLPAGGVPRPEVPLPSLRAHNDALVAELARRAKDLEGKDVPIELSRARVELGIVLEVLLQNRDKALEQYQAAHDAAPSAEAPLMAARWLTPVRPIAQALKLASAHARIASDEASRAERFIQIAELHRSAGSWDEAQKYYRQALSIKPTHPAALRGLEGVLQAQQRKNDSGAAEALAAHLEDMASAAASEPRFAAWLHVERAQLLEAEGKTNSARAALEIARNLDGATPEVRDAYTRHLIVDGATDALVQAWSEYSDMDAEPARAARFEYAAARLASERLDDVNQAIALHARAAARVNANVDVRRGALQELARLQASTGNHLASSEARERHLRLVEDPVRQSHEHRRLAETYELLGQFEDVVRHTLEILKHHPNDDPSRDRLDRSLHALGRHEERIDRWKLDAASTEKPAERAIALVRAARIAERELGDLATAESLYRGAWAADGESTDAFDGLARLLARPSGQPGEVIPEHARARIDLYEQAAGSAADKERRIACLQRVAQIWEDELNQPSRALEVYRRLSELDDCRRSTILGLQRCGALAGEHEVVVQALVSESKAVDAPTLQRSLLLRAAEISAEYLNDSDAAMELIGRVLSRSPGDPLALRSAIRVNNKTGRYEEALGHLRTLLKHARKGPNAFSLCVEIAVLLEEQLHRPHDAVEAYKQAAQHDPEHPIPLIEIPRLLLGLGEHRAAADQLAELAMQASNPYVRARLLVQAAELYDDRLDDLEKAVVVLAQAQALAPIDIAIFERLVRVQLRRGKGTELVPAYEKRIVSTTGMEKAALRAQLASLLAHERDYTRAAGLLQELLTDSSGHVPALRMFELALRRLERWDSLAILLHHQAATLTEASVRLGALHEARYLERHFAIATQDGELPTLKQIRSIAAEDPAVYESLVRETGLTVEGPWEADEIGDALSRLASSYERDSFLSAALHLAAALVFENAAARGSSVAMARALSHYQTCVKAWPTSLTAARGLLRVAQMIGELPAQVEGHCVLGRVESSAKDRAAHNAAAADAIAFSEGDGVTRALELYSTALRDDPDCGPAASGIVALADKNCDPGHIADVLRIVLDKAQSSEQAVLAGRALGRIARERLRDPNGAVEALRKVRDKSPGHVPALLELAEACANLHLWFESGEVGQSVLGISNDRAEHIRALVVLAEAHSHVHAKWNEARREAVDAELAAEVLSNEERRKVAIRLAQVYENIQDGSEQERLMCMEIALAGADPEPLHRLSARHSPETLDGCIAYIQSLNRVLAMVEVLSVPRQPAWLVEIGRLESTRLSRPREGIAKLREAISLDPSRIDSSLALADTLACMGAHDDAALELRSLLATIDPNTLDAEKIATVAAMAKRELEASNRIAQASVAEEIMAYVGYVAPERIQAIRTRRLPEALPQPMAFDRATLERMLVPAVGQGVMFRVASALEDVAHKLLRIEPEGIGATTSMRLNARASHPRRQMADRFARAFGAIAFDIYIDVPSIATPRALPGSPPCILLPLGFDNLPFNEQAVGLTRLLAAVALGVPWLEEISNEDLEGWMFGALQVGRAGWDGGGLHPAKEVVASSWKPIIHRAISRKTRRVLDEIAGEACLDMEPVAWRHAMHLATWRCALVVTGDWTSTFNHAWRSERDLSGIARERIATTMFGHSVLRDLCLWGMSPETTPLLRAVGHRA